MKKEAETIAINMPANLFTSVLSDVTKLHDDVRYTISEGPARSITHSSDHQVDYLFKWVVEKIDRLRECRQKQIASESKLAKVLCGFNLIYILHCCVTHALEAEQMAIEAQSVHVCAL
jgi:hypothetical protein